MSIDVVTGFEASMRADLITPRGLVNNGNMCFMNAVKCFVYNIGTSLHCFHYVAFLILLASHIPDIAAAGPLSTSL